MRSIIEEINLLSKLPVFLILFSCCAIGNIRIGADNWEGYTHPDGSGIYFTLMKEIYPNETLDFVIQPFVRTKNNFEKNKLDIILGVYPEDIHKKIIPYWPLDQESPIVAFYDSRKIKLEHISDIEDISTSWVRGYDFDTFLPLIKPTYSVDRPNAGFKLLLNERVDAFIDYVYNSPKSLPAYIKTFQLIPARKVYAAFQNNLRGKELAKKFNTEMAKLTKSGELADIFGNDYDAAAFAKYVKDKTEVIIYTDERDLLGINKSALTKSHSSLYNVAMLLDEQLPEFNFSYQKLVNVEKALANKQQSITCVINALKTDRREKEYAFSLPIMLYQGLRLYSTTKLLNSTTVDLSKTLTGNSHYKLGVQVGRSYGSSTDKSIESINKNQIFYASHDTILAIKQLDKKRFNLMIESPIVFDHYWKEISQHKKIYNYELASTTPYITSNLICNKSQGTDNFIRHVNKALERLYQTGIFYKAQKSLTSNINQQSFLKAYKENFN